MVKLPLVSGREDFKTLLKTMGLQARGTGGVDSASTGGTWDISNADRIGKGEVQLCNILIEGATKLIKWENMMEEGDKAAAEAEIEAMVGASASAAASRPLRMPRRTIPRLAWRRTSRSWRVGSRPV